MFSLLKDLVVQAKVCEHYVQILLIYQIISWGITVTISTGNYYSLICISYDYNYSTIYCVHLQLHKIVILIN